MTPIGTLIASIGFGAMIKLGEEKEKLQKQIFVFVVVKVVLCGLITAFVALFFQAKPLDEYSLDTGESSGEKAEQAILTQFLDLIKDKIYILFVYGPLLSIASLESLDSHISRILYIFKFTSVKNLIIIRCKVLLLSLY